mgnify:CR=1 FL=1
MSPDVRLRAFPGMSPLMLDLLASGDLQRELPGWRDHLVAEWCRGTGYSADDRMRAAWRRVLTEYDAATNQTEGK